MPASVAAGSFTGQGGKIGNLWSACFTGRTGNGSQETIPHGLGRRPVFIFAQVDDEATATATLGVSDSTNILVTVTNGKTYSILALI